MLWFEGSIPEAIMASKQRKLPFVVYIVGTDEVSAQMNDVWSDPEVSDLLSRERCVAIKLVNESEQCTQFSQLYPVVCVPSTFFIGENGMPLELLGGLQTASELTSKANAAFEAYHSQKVASINTPPSTQAQSDFSEEANSHNDLSTSAQANASVEERVDRAKKLIEQKREEKADKEKQEQIEKETKRRKEGQQVLNAQRELEEKKQKELMAQIREDRANERSARKAVKQQIARDKAEREAQRQAELRERQQARQTAEGYEGTAAATSYSPDRTADANYSNVRLQFRLPDGNSVTNTFPADALFEAARQFIEGHLGSRYGPVTMSTTYPRRQLTDEDLLQTLAALGLAPSSTIIISTDKGKSHVPAMAGESTGMLMWLLAPLFTFINMINTFLFGSPSTPRGSYGGVQTDREEVSPDQGKKEDSSVRKRVTPRRDPPDGGNIHRFRNSNDDDDENSTWNGNSTQQM